VGSILAACVLTGVVTIYQEPYVGRPLYCSSPAEPRYYDVNSPAAWIALDAAYYESGRARCGDQVLVTGAVDGSGWAVIVQALDAGPLSAYYIEQWPDKPIVADLPAHLAPFSGLSAPARLINLSELRRQMQGKVETRHALIP
jgi:hypothetical protein